MPRAIRSASRLSRFASSSGSVLRERGLRAFVRHWVQGARGLAAAVANDVSGRTLHSRPWVGRSPEEKRRIIERAAAAARRRRDPLGAGPAGGASGPAAAPGPAPAPGPAAKLIAFYLPQFHRIPENDEWWGEGFTEWVSVRRARPDFAGHRQPVEPGELGHYDLSDSRVLHRQIALAREHGIHGFCFYYYWFDGRRLLETPLDRFVADGAPDFPFCICWANHDWTRTWAGSDEEMLLEQEYPDGYATRFIHDVIPLLKDERYLRVGGAPLLLVSLPDRLPDARKAAAHWREECRKAGLPGLHLALVQNPRLSDPRPFGFDAAVEFPPNVRTDSIDASTYPGIDPAFRGRMVDYVELARVTLSAAPPPFVHYRGVTPAWDDTPRRLERGRIYVDSSPELYQAWLEEAIGLSLRRSSAQEPLIFLNAWNEWGEGAYLEPDAHEGRARLEATRDALARYGAGRA